MFFCSPWSLVKSYSLTNTFLEGIGWTANCKDFHTLGWISLDSRSIFWGWRISLGMAKFQTNAWIYEVWPKFWNFLCVPGNICPNVGYLHVDSLGVYMSSVIVCTKERERPISPVPPKNLQQQPHFPPLLVRFTTNFISHKTFSSMYQKVFPNKKSVIYQPKTRKNL